MVPSGTAKNGQSVLEQVGPNIIHHVSNSDISHPIIHIPKIFGIDFSITKHVFMLWLVSIIVATVIIIPIQKYINSNGKDKSRWMIMIEYITEFIRNAISSPNVGPKWMLTWTPLFLTFFFFILFANGIGLVPIFDTIGLIDRFFLKTQSDSFINNLFYTFLLNPRCSKKLPKLPDHTLIPMFCLFEDR